MFFVRGIEIDRVRPKLTCFESMIDLVFVWLAVVEIDLVLDTGRKSLGFSVSIEIHLVLSGWSMLT